MVDVINLCRNRYPPEFIPRTKVEVVIKDVQVETLIDKLTERLGDVSGGKVFVTDVYHLSRSLQYFYKLFFITVCCL